MNEDDIFALVNQAIEDKMLRGNEYFMTDDRIPSARMVNDQYWALFRKISHLQARIDELSKPWWQRLIGR